jgi:hypothetical protein
MIPKCLTQNRKDLDGSQSTIPFKCDSLRDISPELSSDRSKEHAFKIIVERVLAQATGMNVAMRNGGWKD